MVEQNVNFELLFEIPDCEIYQVDDESQ